MVILGVMEKLRRYNAELIVGGHSHNGVVVRGAKSDVREIGAVGRGVGVGDRKFDCGPLVCHRQPHHNW